MTTLAVFANRNVGPLTIQSVPTTVVQAGDGSFFVGELTGFPFPVGAARVYRVPAGGGTLAVVAEGFTNIIDIAADASGGGWVLEHDADGIIGPGTAGRLIRVAANGTQTVMTGANLTKPGGIAIGPDGAIYVTNNSISAGGGEVVRLTP
jgi:sugar lactone lactonase YvrE